MEVSEVRVRLAERKQDRLRAFCSVTFDNAFVIRDVKVIQGEQGLFVAMPSRKLTDRCPSCRAKNQLRSRYCSDCGAKLTDHRAQLDDRGRPRLYVDIAHPVNAEARMHIEKAVLAAYQEELVRSHEPGYEALALYEGELEEPDEFDHHFEVDERRQEERRPEGRRESPPERPEPRPERQVLPHDRREPPQERREPLQERREPPQERREPPQERREPTPERRDAPHDRREPPQERREPAPERREAPHDRREPPQERREPTPDRREPPRTPPSSPAPKPPQTKRRFGEGILDDEGEGKSSG
jgi:stage V sporulation protein G